ncbi:hypothetical protein GOBAR_AA04816 [Gossypium barbadense]|uniref:Uncharacterized protein n=1 Tax=Gossypium barbadense TaxID=3634 RepID=A0A2P5YJL0_GOSBA|nr:hypothetical protein GOBAR_AA04816 [Gossypium barbadense]
MNKGREEVNNNDPKQEFLQTKTTETVRYYHEENKDVHEERRLRIEELDEWREHKPRTRDKLKLRKNKLDTSLNQLKVGDTILLDAFDPHIVTTTPNEEIPLTVLSICPFGTVEKSHPKFGVSIEIRPITWSCLRPCAQHGGKHSRTIRPCKNREKHGRGDGNPQLYRALKLIITEELKLHQKMVLHDCHVLLDHDNSYH